MFFVIPEEQLLIAKCAFLTVLASAF